MRSCGGGVRCTTLTRENCRLHMRQAEVELSAIHSPVEAAAAAFVSCVILSKQSIGLCTYIRIQSTYFTSYYIKK